MPSTDRPSSIIIKDVRLIEESLIVNDEVVRKRSSTEPSGAKINAETKASTSVKLEVVEAETAILGYLIVDVRLSAEIRFADNGDELLKCFSLHRGRFSIYGQAGTTLAPEQFGSPIVAPSVNQIIWVATRRAEQAIFATGLAQLRLAFPEISPDAVADETLKLPNGRGADSKARKSAKKRKPSLKKS